MSKFQIILLVFFGVARVGGALVFSLYRGSSEGSVTLTVWGDISSQDFNLWLNSPSFGKDKTFILNYMEKSAETIDAEFTEALARDAGPDLVILTQDKLWKNRPKLAVIPFSSVNERDFKETFVEESELLINENGIYALPLSIDPMVLYYNRDLLSAA